MEKRFDDESSVQLRYSENFYDRKQVGNDQSTGERMLELHHTFTKGRHSLVWGADYTQDRFTADEGRAQPDSFVNNQGSAFIQNEITLADAWWLTLGYRAHYNQINEFDWAGNVASIHEFVPEHTVRAAIAKSFRRPILFQVFAFRPNGRTAGNRNLLNEELVSFELGYRGKLRSNLELNVETFFNQYRDMMGSQKIGTVTSFFNSHDIKMYGFETSIDWRPKQWWHVRASHSFEYIEDAGNLSDRTSGGGNLAIWSAPKHKFALLNRFYLGDKTTLNTQIYWSDKFFERSPARNTIRAYMRIDIHLARKFWGDRAELAIGGTNIGGSEHYEGSSNLSKVPLFFTPS